MSKDAKWFRFGGACVGVAEDELGASLNDCSQAEHERFIDALYAEYLGDGEPGNLRRWLRERLEPLFPCLGERPHWVEKQPAWPWLNGKPMAFLHQFQVPLNAIANSHLVAGATLYIFAGKVSTNGGWRMEYRVVEQRSELKGVVALVESLEEPHTPKNTKLVKRRDDT